jgi:outer membrane protein TolC
MPRVEIGLAFFQRQIVEVFRQSVRGVVLQLRDVTGRYDFSEELRPLEEYQNIALAARPDLKAAEQNVDLAKITYKLTVANGSADPPGAHGTH